MRVAEVIAALDAVQQRRAAKVVESGDLKYRRFYASRAFRAAKYTYMKSLPRPLRCQCCGATAQDERLVIDHIVPIKVDWSRRFDPTNFQLLCNTHNLAKASSDQTDWRADKIEAAS